MKSAVVCGVAESACSWSALRVADDLAMRCNRPLSVLSVDPESKLSHRLGRAERLHEDIRRVVGRDGVALIMDVGDPAERLARPVAERRCSSSETRDMARSDGASVSAWSVLSPAVPHVR